MPNGTTLISEPMTTSYVSAEVLLQPLRWCCVDCVIHHERDVREE